jgi:hypothetical protein
MGGEGIDSKERERSKKPALKTKLARAAIEIDQKTSPQLNKFRCPARAFQMMFTQEKPPFIPSREATP